MIESWSPLAALILGFWALMHQFSVSAVSWRKNRHQLNEQMRLRKTVLAYPSLVARLSSLLSRTTTSANAMAWRILEVADVIEESAACRPFYLVDPYGQNLQYDRQIGIELARDECLNCVPRPATDLVIEA